MWNFVSPILGILIFFINAIQILFILHTNNTRGRRRLSIPLVFILNLSISDFLVGLTELLIKTMFWIGSNHHSFKNKAYRDIYQYLLFVFLRISLLVSVLNLIAITIDRLFCVVRPIQYRTKASRSSAVIVCITLWTISLITMSSYYYGMKNLTDNYTSWRMDLLFFPLVTLPTFPLLSTVYAFIWCRVRKANKTFSGGEQFQGSATTRDGRQHQTRSVNGRRRQEHSLLILAFAVVIAFLVCWLPISIYSLLKIFEVKIIAFDLDNIMFVVAMSNSVLNPLLYFHSIRRRIGRLIKQAISIRTKRFKGTPPSRLRNKDSSASVGNIAMRKSNLAISTLTTVVTEDSIF